MAVLQILQKYRHHPSVYQLKLSETLAEHFALNGKIKAVLSQKKTKTSLFLRPMFFRVTYLLYLASKSCESYFWEIKFFRTTFLPFCYILALSAKLERMGVLFIYSSRIEIFYTSVNVENVVLVGCIMKFVECTKSLLHCSLTLKHLHPYSDFVPLF